MSRYGAELAEKTTALAARTFLEIVEVPLSATANTTDATTTTLLTGSGIASGQVGVVRLTVVAKNGTLNGAGWAMEATFKNDGGTVSQVGATLTTLSVQDAALITATAEFDVTGATFRVRVTGILATNISWAASGRLTTV